MITMGLDCSTTSTGWAIFKNDKLLDYGVIKPKGEDWRERLYQEGTPLTQIINKYKPNKIYMEDVPLKKTNLKALLILGAVQGFVYGIVSHSNIPIEFLLPNEWRSELNMYDGSREGTKREVLKHKAIEKANEIFNLNLIWVSPNSKKNEDDIAEAILICYSQVFSKCKLGRPSKTRASLQKTKGGV